MQWEAPEHTYYEKTNDWYLSTIIIAGALLAVELMTKNYLLMALTIIGTIAFILTAARRPEIVPIEIRRNGIRFNKTLYLYENLDGYAIIDYTQDRRLLLESNKKIMPLIVIHLPDDLDLEMLHEELSQYLPEKELHESLPHLLLERVGF